jgi:predicted HicB family RNase H-like nuclease
LYVIKHVDKKMDRFNLRYKGYTGSIEFSKEDKVYYGTLQNTQDLISYEGCDLYDLEMSFKEAVEDYTSFKQEIKGK